MVNEFLAEVPVCNPVASRPALNELMRRVLYGSWQLKASALAELAADRIAARLPDVECIDKPPPTRRGERGRSPDRVLRLRDGNGSGQLSRGETKALTSAPTVARLSRQILAGMGIDMAPDRLHRLLEKFRVLRSSWAALSPSERRALLQSLRPLTARKPSQLKADLANHDGEAVPPGGLLDIVLTHAGERPAAMFQEVLSLLGAYLRNATYIHSFKLVVVRVRGNATVGERTIGEWVRGKSGLYLPDEAAQQEIEKERQESPAPDASSEDGGLFTPPPEKGEASPGPAAPCPGMALGGIAGFFPAVLGVGAEPDCGGDEEKAKESNGLLKAVAAAAAGETGGIDFTSIELRYLSDVAGDGENEVSYAFTAAPGKTKPEDVVRGLANAQQASDALFVWLALPASDFWVNLNPNEPHRIIDEDFGRTDAGRILLEADLRLKQTVAELTHPRSRTGARFWSRLWGREKCVSMRQWIVPAPATVHATDEELHILRAPLRVMMETEYVQERGTGEYSSCEGQSRAEGAHNERVYRRLVLPKVERRVNAAPEYADLRRVYLSRVAAEWIRERHGYQRTAYDKIIGSGKIGRWVTRTKWRPTDTFRRYVRSYTRHEWEVTDEIQRGNAVYTHTYVFGGVDFSSAPQHRIGDEAFARHFPERVKLADRALQQATRDPETRRTWLGGTTVVPTPEAPGAAGDDLTTESVPIWLAVLGIMVALGCAVAFAIGRRLRRSGS